MTRGPTRPQWKQAFIPLLAYAHMTILASRAYWVPLKSDDLMHLVVRWLFGHIVVQCPNFSINIICTCNPLENILYVFSDSTSTWAALGNLPSC